MQNGVSRYCGWSDGITDYGAWLAKQVRCLRAGVDHDWEVYYITSCFAFVIAFFGLAIVMPSSQFSCEEKSTT